MVGDNLSRQIQEKVQAWLMEEGWSLRKESDPKAIWVFTAEDRFGRKVGVGQEVGKEDMVVMQATVTLDEDTINRIAQLPKPERDEIIWNLRFEVIRTELEFDGLGEPLEKISVGTRIFSDALTKDLFLLRTSQVRKGLLIIQWVLAKALAQKPPQIGFET